MKVVSAITGLVLFAGSAVAQCGMTTSVASAEAKSDCSAAKQACGMTDTGATSMTVAFTEPTLNIVETAAGAGTFETLLAAATAAGLADALTGEGPLTVFAPTDDAFAALPEGTVESLLQPENIDTLKAILLYHVVAGDVRAAQVVDLNTADTLNGQRVDIAVNGSNVMIDNARVVSADVLATNGTIHVIDKVLMPSTDDIIDTAVAAGSFGTLATAIKTAGLVEALKGDGPFTVFAPTDEAFAALPAGTVANLLKPENRDQLTSILTYHVVSGRVYSDQAIAAGTATTLQGDAITITSNNDGVMINGASVISADLDTSNGVIHVIDSVLLPE
ncbi:MAG: fasciclin domain-containing protein [Planctomycetota bacterium]